MTEPVDGVTLTSTYASSSTTFPVEWELPVERWVIVNVLSMESFFATDYSDVHIMAGGIVHATLGENDWVVSVPGEEEMVCDKYEPDQIPM